MSASPPLRSRPYFGRDQQDRIITGVAGGLARAIGVDSLFVRIGFVLLSFAGGIGVIVYIAAYLCSSDRLRGSHAGMTAGRPITQRHTVGFMCVVTGSLMFAQSIGAGFAPAVMVPLALAAAGSAVVWARTDELERARLVRDPVQMLTAHAGSRLVVGGLVLSGGIGIFLSQADAFASARSAFLGVIATGVGLAVVLGPWFVRLYHQLTEERRVRIRSEERAEMSAHLHDSVLHTLALIQRSQAPPDVIALARRQERELRAWMQGHTSSPGDCLRDAIEAITGRVEELHPVTIDLVLVGDCPIDEQIQGFLHAVQEGVMNAAQHSGVNTIAVYVEVESGDIVGYVRDQGKGFDQHAVPPDRRGIVESIEGRMRRIGGHARIHSTPGEGTEIELRAPRQASR